MSSLFKLGFVPFAVHTYMTISIIYTIYSLFGHRSIIYLKLFVLLLKKEST
jgi:hypothetical protein